MLRDYIVMYSEALSNNDKKEIERIERELSRLGMDKITAKILVQEYRDGKL